MGTESYNGYKVVKSRTVRYVTVAVWVVVALVFIAVWYMLLREPFYVTPFVIMLLTTAFVLGLLLYYYLISPRSIRLTDGALVLRRVLGCKTFRYADIAEAGVYEGGGSDMFRFCGSGAFCGFIGWFSGGGLGVHFEYVGRYQDAFYLKLRSGRTYLLSCDGAAQVVSRVREGMEMATG